MLQTRRAPWRWRQEDEAGAGARGRKGGGLGGDLGDSRWPCLQVDHGGRDPLSSSVAASPGPPGRHSRPHSGAGPEEIRGVKWPLLIPALRRRPERVRVAAAQHVWPEAETHPQQGRSGAPLYARTVPPSFGPARRASPGPPVGEGSQPRQHCAQLPPRRWGSEQGNGGGGGEPPGQAPHCRQTAGIPRRATWPGHGSGFQAVSCKNLS